MLALRLLGEGMAARVRGGWSHHIQIGEAETDSFLVSPSHGLLNCDASRTVGLPAPLP